MMRNFRFDTDNESLGKAKLLLTVNLKSLFTLKSDCNLIEVYQIIQEYILLDDQQPQFIEEILTYGLEGWRNLNKIDLED